MHTVQKTSRTVTRFAGHPDEIEALVEQAKHPQPPADAPPMYPCPCYEKTTAWYVGRSSSWLVDGIGRYLTHGDALGVDGDSGVTAHAHRVRASLYANRPIAVDDAAQVSKE